MGWGGEAGRGQGGGEGVSPNVNYRVPRFCSMLSVITCPAQPRQSQQHQRSPRHRQRAGELMGGDSDLNIRTRL